MILVYGAREVSIAVPWASIISAVAAGERLPGAHGVLDPAAASCEEPAPGVGGRYLVGSGAASGSGSGSLIPVAVSRGRWPAAAAEACYLAQWDRRGQLGDGAPLAKPYS